MQRIDDVIDQINKFKDYRMPRYVEQIRQNHQPSMYRTLRNEKIASSAITNTSRNGLHHSQNKTRKVIIVKILRNK